MRMYRSGNPTLQVFEKPRWDDLDPASTATREISRAMTLRGTVIASAVLVAICAISAILSWQAITVGLFSMHLSPMLVLLGGMFGGLVVGLVISFVPKTAPYLSPVYAVLEGGLIAAFSLIIAERWLGGAKDPAALGTIFQAVVLTFTIAAGMLIAYGTGLVRGGKVFTAVAMTGGLGLMLYVAVLWIGNGLFGANIPNLYASTSPIGIGFTAISLVLASMFLVLDFRIIDEGVRRGAPKYMEWYGAFSLLVTLVWIYIEVLRLLAKMRSND
ncbi:MAG TPA: Bax inhibitor-1/YccA family protein [Phycisphaerales bacterium]|nr:Bax inhibitor-1/YccA family protein [Phycisphaerales bacterium]